MSRRSENRSRADPPPPRSNRRSAGSRTSSSRCRTAASAGHARCTRSPPQSTTTPRPLPKSPLRESALWCPRGSTASSRGPPARTTARAANRCRPDGTCSPCRTCAPRRRRSAPRAGRASLSFSSAVSMRTSAIVVDISRPFAVQRELSPGGHRRDDQPLRCHSPPSGQIASQGSPASMQVLHLRAVVRWLVKLHLFDVLVRERQAEAVAKRLEVVEAELLLLMRGHPALARGAHAEALHRLREDHRRLAAMRERLRIRCVKLAHVVAAAAQAVDVLVAQLRSECGKLGVLAEETLAVVRAVVGREGLELAVDRVRERAQQRAGAVACKQRVPIGAPHHLDHVPAGADEVRFEFVDDAAVAAHRAVEPLQVAVDHEHEVVEPFARRKRQTRRSIPARPSRRRRRSPTPCGLRVCARPRFADSA